MTILRKKGLISDYREIRLEPYYPQGWIGRGMTLLNLGYGELAVADAYRGRLLIEAFRAGERKFSQDFLSRKVDRDTLVCKIYKTVFIRVAMPSKWKGWAEAHQQIIAVFNEMEERAFITMIEGLRRIGAFHDAIGVADEARKRFPANSIFKGYVEMLPSHQRALDQECRKKGIKNPGVRKVGRAHRVQYPWIAQEEVTRSKKAIKRVKANIEAVSDNAVLDASALSNGTEGSFGIFAKRNIPKGERVVLDKSIFSSFNKTAKNACDACCAPLPSNPITLECCNVRYCSESCKAEAARSYHKTLCRTKNTLTPIRSEMTWSPCSWSRF